MDAGAFYFDGDIIMNFLVPAAIGFGASSLMGGGGGGGSSGSIQQVPKLTAEQEQLVALLGRTARPAISGVTGPTIPGMEFAPGGPSPLQQQAFGMAGQDISQMMRPVSQFTQQQFEQEYIPSIMGALGAGGMARSSGAPEILGRQARNLNLGMAAQFAPMQFQQPGMMAGLGGIQRGIGEEQRGFGLQRFMAGAPEQDPRLGFIGPAFTSAYDTAVQQGYYEPSIGSQLLGLGGSVLGGMAMGGTGFFA